MAESLIISDGNKNERYSVLYSQIRSLLDSESDLIANMANVSSMIHQTFGFWWTGFYIARGDQLVLGPFQGPPACTRIPFGKGVCGTAWMRKESIIVPDVEEFPGHIACSSLSRSEIVVPVIQNSEVTAVIDIDSKELDTFDDTDRIWLEKIGTLFAGKTA